MTADITNVYYRANVDKIDEGKYFCIVKNEFGTAYSDTTDVAILVDIKHHSETSANIISQIRPNPFTGRAIISYNVMDHSSVSLVVYDVYGNEIKTLVNGYKVPGRHEIQFRAAGMVSGVYYYTISIGDKVETGKFVLIK